MYLCLYWRGLNVKYVLEIVYFPSCLCVYEHCRLEPPGFGGASKLIHIHGTL